MALKTIRVGLIGLSTNTNPMTPGAWTASAHLPYLLSTPHYEITALCNSTVESAERTREFHKLPTTVSTYGSPSDLAQDPNVDLVVVSVNVEKHDYLAMPALQAGKDVYVEWPLAHTTAAAKELTALAKTKGVKTAVGLQARPSPIGQKIRELIAAGWIGKVLSTDILAVNTLDSRNGMPESFYYYLTMASGGNSLTITFGHVIDHLVHILGPFASIQALLQVQRPTVDLLDAQGKKIRTAEKDSPDQILVQGQLANGAAASVHFRTGVPADEKHTRWIITGDEGEIEITTSAIAWQITAPGIELRIKNSKTGDVEIMSFDDSIEKDDQEDAVIDSLPPVSKNIGRVYEAFRKGETDKFATFEDALERQRFLDQVVKSAKEGKRVDFQ
ncbi:transcription regulator gal80 [Bachmanniomyces sp. S44760]|nr:transcription regulator gal80 [Bachmanniomyces sp. S44760]